jgi:hypothetical protein
MLLEQRARDGILAGTITVLFRRWRKSRLPAGERAELDKRLARLEARREPWIEETLRLIGRRAGVSTRERDAFKPSRPPAHKKPLLANSNAI